MCATVTSASNGPAMRFKDKYMTVRKANQINKAITTSLFMYVVILESARVKKCKRKEAKNNLIKVIFLMKLGLA